jgi:malonyl-CoA O-methyltransferase
MRGTFAGADAHVTAAAAAYDEAAVLPREVGARMAARLDYIKLAPRRIADIGCATGDGIRALHTRYPAAQALAIDRSLAMLHGVHSSHPLNPLRAGWRRLFGGGLQRLNADVRALPLADGTLDLVWSNLMLHWLTDPLPALREIHRVLAVDGLLMFATLGPDTLRELREAARKVGTDGPTALQGGRTKNALLAVADGDTAPRFPDMHDLGDMLVAGGFADPVMDMEMITLNYRQPRQFLADQRHLGARDHLLGAPSARPFRQWRKLFKALPRDAAGHLPFSFEIVYGHAWKPAANPIRHADENHRPTRQVIHFQRRPESLSGSP